MYMRHGQFLTAHTLSLCSDVTPPVVRSTTTHLLLMQIMSHSLDRPREPRATNPGWPSSISRTRPSLSSLLTHQPIGWLWTRARWLSCPLPLPCLVLGLIFGSFGSLASCKAPELSSKVLHRIVGGPSSTGIPWFYSSNRIILDGGERSTVQVSPQQCSFALIHLVTCD
jgi:hypothetical protein